MASSQEKQSEPVAISQASLPADGSLITRAIAGDESAFEALAYRHFPALRAIIDRQFPKFLRRLYDPTDIVQDTLFEACRRIGGFKLDQSSASDGHAAFFAWLAEIARCQVLALIRRHHAASRLSDVMRAELEAIGGDEADGEVLRALGELVGHRRSPSKSAAAHEAIAELEAAISTLPKHWSDLIRVRYLEGHSAKEAAEMLGHPSEDAVRMACRRALQALKGTLGTESKFF